MTEYQCPENRPHHHRGKSSESHLDKRLILAHLSIGPGQTILDAGCGNGYMAREFARLTGATGRVYALDPDGTAIAALQAETAGSVIEAFVGDITRETQLTTASLDLLYLSTVLHGFSRTQLGGFITEAGRLLKPGGRLAVVELHKKETPFGPPLERRFAPEELQRAIPLRPDSLTAIGDFFYLQVFRK